MPRDVRDQCAGFRARPWLTSGSRGLYDLYGWNRASLQGQFLSLLEVLTKILDFFYSAITLVSGIIPILNLREGYVFQEGVSAYCLVLHDDVFIEEVLQGFSLNPAFEKHFGLSTDVRSQNWCSCLDLICDRGVRTKGSRKFVPGKRHPPILCFVRCWPSEISFLYI
ncbi:hypothetical protein F2Q69_00006006 [Brassica cretica]|uniref:Uncharacterized protein n=1 Tax=Brassica cretica TaxID=69181 RepID=A0A8S9P892_BRACR|nr:hypothetical protein F2Q69_00006006 [Brassica cretica]